MSVGAFSQLFRQEHREIRDALLHLMDAYSRRDTDGARKLIGQVASLTGPHFRYEEEALYPSLEQIFGDEFIEMLLIDHDGAIGTVKQLVELASQDELSSDDAREGRERIRRLLYHVSDCEGLSIMVERIPEETVASVLEARDRARSENLDLFEWAGSMRPRSYTLPFRNYRRRAIVEGTV